MLTVTGLDVVARNVRQLAKSMPDKAAQALNIIAEETMTDAKNRTPVDTGTLRRSGHVEHASKDRLRAILSFGTEYAIFVHENLNARHKVGEAKFLENAIKFTAHFFEHRLANEMMGNGRGAGATSGVGI